MKIYTPSEIYNCDETSLYYRSIAKKCFVTKGDDCKGIKVKKDRINLFVMLLHEWGKTETIYYR